MAKRIEWENEIVNFMKAERVVTSSEIAAHLKVSWNTAEKYLMELALNGKAERFKKSGVNIWILR